MLRSVAIASFLAINAVMVSSCTFSMGTSQRTTSFGGSNVVSCQFRAWLSDEPDLYNDTPDAYNDDMPCSGGEGSLNINGNDWTMTFDGFGVDIQLGGTATIEGLSTETIYPGAEESSWIDENPLAQSRGYFYWKSGIAC